MFENRLNIWPWPHSDKTWLWKFGEKKSWNLNLISFSFFTPPLQFSPPQDKQLCQLTRIQPNWDNLFQHVRYHCCRHHHLMMMIEMMTIIIVIIIITIIGKQWWRSSSSKLFALSCRSCRSIRTRFSICSKRRPTSTWRGEDDDDDDDFHGYDDEYGAIQFLSNFLILNKRPSAKRFTN